MRIFYWSFEDPGKDPCKDLFKIRILQDLKRILSGIFPRSLSGSSRILKDTARIKDLYKDFWKIFVRLLEEFVIWIFQGSLKDLYKDLWKIFFAGKYLLKVFGMILQGSSRKLWGSYKNLSKVYVWISYMWTSSFLFTTAKVAYYILNWDDLLSCNSSLHSS